MGSSCLEQCTPHRTEDIPLLHDPSRCLEDHGYWDVITMISDLANVSPDAVYVGGVVEDRRGNRMTRISDRVTPGSLELQSSTRFIFHTT